MATSEMFSVCTATGAISLAAMVPGAALYFSGAAGQNRCVLPTSDLEEQLFAVI